MLRITIQKAEIIEDYDKFEDAIKAADTPVEFSSRIGLRRGEAEPLWANKL